METMSSSIQPAVVPRTANLLACKQWWRVCFLYGDQQKYYRQVYSQAAAQRLAAKTAATITSKDENENDNEINATTNTKGRRSSCTDRDYDIITDFIDAQLGELPTGCRNNNSNIDNINSNHMTVDHSKQQATTTMHLFPAKYQSGATSNGTALSTMSKTKKLIKSLRKSELNSNNNNKSDKHVESLLDAAKTNTRINVLDDPFLFGIDEDHLGDLIRPKQYNINATEDITNYLSDYVEEQQQQQPVNELKPALPPKKKPRPLDMQPDFQLNQSDLEFLNLNLRKRGFPRILPHLENSETHDISFTFNEESEILEQLTENLKQEKVLQDLDNKNSSDKDDHDE